ncbi:MAG: hypothetical protein JXB47_04760 [Anaerolineae bacterium]|nr:hypothetical protein [Anaerolineae bacterium]
MIENGGKLSARRRHLALLLELEVAEFQDSAEEHERMSKETFDSEEFPIWAEIELFADAVRGGASQIAHEGVVSKPEAVLEHLRKSSIFDLPSFSQWYFNQSGYSKTKTDTRTLDYIRLLSIEYITLQFQYHEIE